MHTNKKHWYLVYATYEDARNSSKHMAEGTFSLSSTNINKSMLAIIRTDLIKRVLEQNTDLEIENFKLHALSYLGEMTEQAFNA
ncbi:hypothetical protein [Acinetobacter larvae]|nr:hypothetical protein [Acinetobacter larvae]